MKNLILLVVFFFPIMVFGQLENDSWAIGFGGLEDNDEIGSIAATPNGDIAVGGIFTNSITIGDTTINGVSGINCYFAIFDSLSNFKTITLIPEGEYIFDIKSDYENNIYVLGVDDYKDEKYSSMFFNKYDEQGQLISSRNLTGTYIDCKNIIIDSENHLYLFGQSEDGLIYGGTFNNFTGYRSFLLKADQNMDQIYFKLLFIEGYFPEKICINNIDDIFITLQTYIQGEELQIFKLNKEADTIWGKMIQPVTPFEGNGVYSTSLCADENGLLVCGKLDVPVNFHNYTIIEPYYNIDTFIARYDLEGNLIWIKNDNTFGWNGIVNSTIIPDENGFIITGSFQGQAIIGDSIYTVCPLGCDHDIFISAFDNSGNLSYFKQGGGTGNACDYSREIIQDSYGNIYNAGGFGDIGYFGNDTIYGNSWGFDCYLLKFNPEDNWLMTSLPERFVFDQPEIEIFPNPATNKIKISSKQGFIINEIAIYDLKGQKVLHKYLTSNKIDISSLREGIYILELMTNETRYKEKLIIR